MNLITKETRQESNVKVDRNTRYEEIVGLLKLYPKGLTARELAYKLGYTERNAVAPRLTELCDNNDKVPDIYKKLIIVDGKRFDELTKTNVSVYKLKIEEKVNYIIQGNVNYGYKMKCENCEYGLLERDEKLKAKGYFCRKMKSDIGITQYRKMRVCSFFEKKT